jgi:hypothetical protein
LALNHNSLQNYYTTVFALVQHHKYSITEINNLIPFERDIFVDMLASHLKEVEETKQRMKQ